MWLFLCTATCADPLSSIMHPSCNHVRRKPLAFDAHAERSDIWFISTLSYWVTFVWLCCRHWMEFSDDSKKTLLLLSYCVFFLRRMRSKFGEIHRKSMRSEAQTWFEEKGEKLKCQRLSWTHTQKHCHCRRPLLTLHSWHIRWTFAWHIFRQSLTVTLNSNCTVTSKSGVVLANTDGKGWEKSQNPSRERWKSLLSLSRFLLWTLQAPHFFAHWSLSTKQTAGAQ